MQTMSTVETKTVSSRQKKPQNVIYIKKKKTGQKRTILKHSKDHNDIATVLLKILIWHQMDIRMNVDRNINTFALANTQTLGHS